MLFPVLTAAAPIARERKIKINPSLVNSTVIGSRGSRILRKSGNGIELIALHYRYESAKKA
jgi:hypothetical protein